ncbi:MAG: hypothetical protein Q9167_006459 [Letrouitia subvulpina]
MPYKLNTENWQRKETQPQQNKRKYDEAFQPSYTQRTSQSETASTSSMESTISNSNTMTPLGDVFTFENTMEEDPHLGSQYWPDVADIASENSRLPAAASQQAYWLATTPAQYGNLASINASVDAIDVADVQGHCSLSDNGPHLRMANPYHALTTPVFQANVQTSQPISFLPEFPGYGVEVQSLHRNMPDVPWTQYSVPNTRYYNAASLFANDRTNTALQEGRHSSYQPLPEARHPDNVIDRYQPEGNAGPATGATQPYTRARRVRALSKHVKAKAKIMRKVRSCWGCAVRRAPVRGPSETTMLCAQHQPEKLREFCKERIKSRTRNEMEVFVTWGYGGVIKCDVEEVEPLGDALLFQNQWKKNPATDKYDYVRTASPPIGIMYIATEAWRPKLNGYLDETIQKDFAGFPENCIRGKDVLVQKELLNSIFRYYSTDPANGTLKLCLKHVLLTYIVSHSLTLVEETKAMVFQKLQRRPSKPYGLHTSSRMLNKQLKFLLFFLHRQHLKDLLIKIDKAMHTSNRPPWAVAFASLLLLTMTTESMQITVRCKESMDKYERTRTTNDGEATKSIKEMERTLEFIQKLFQQAYRTDARKRSKNPIQNIDFRKELDYPSQVFAREVEEIIDRHRKTLRLKATEYEDSHQPQVFFSMHANISVHHQRQKIREAHD